MPLHAAPDAGGNSALQGSPLRPEPAGGAEQQEAIDDAGVVGGQLLADAAAGRDADDLDRPAFPSGISGTELTRKATLQAQRFDAVLSSFHRAVELVNGPEGMVRVDLDDGQHMVARTLLVATGAQWRTLEVEGIDRFKGAGVYHVAMPPMRAAARART